jgi:hypothetical protein
LVFLAAAIILAAAPAPSSGQVPGPAPGPAATEAKPAAQEQVTPEEATTVLGQTVMSEGGESIGRIVDVLVDEHGKPRAAVVDFGGFMGIGDRKIAVAWRALHFAPAEKGSRRITLEMTPDQIKATPGYTPSSKPVTVAAPPGATPAPPAAAPSTAPSPAGAQETAPPAAPDAPPDVTPDAAPGASTPPAATPGPASPAPAEAR